MINFEQLNKIWAKALRNHAVTPYEGPAKVHIAINSNSLAFLEGLWEARRTPLPPIGAMIEAGKVVRFWSDPHFEHDNIRRLANRTAFASVEEMDLALWRNLEDAVAKSDLVICLGDLALKNPFGYQRKIVSVFGDKHLTVVGNHDAKSAKPEAWAEAGAAASLAFSLPLDLLRSWVEEDHAVMAGRIDWKRLSDRVNFGCSHWPVPAERLPGASWVSVHGHIHNATREDCKLGPLGINCSIEAIDYRPKTLRELVRPELFENLARR